MNWCRRSSINILARFILYESSWAGQRINEKVRCSFLRFGQPHKIESFTKVVMPFIILEVESCLRQNHVCTYNMGMARQSLIKFRAKRINWTSGVVFASIAVYITSCNVVQVRMVLFQIYIQRQAIFRYPKAQHDIYIQYIYLQHIYTIYVPYDLVVHTIVRSLRPHLF